MDGCVPHKGDSATGHFGGQSVSQLKTRGSVSHLSHLSLLWLCPEVRIFKTRQPPTPTQNLMEGILRAHRDPPFTYPPDTSRKSPWGGREGRRQNNNPPSKCSHWASGHPKGCSKGEMEWTPNPKGLWPPPVSRPPPAPLFLKSCKPLVHQGCPRGAALGLPHVPCFSPHSCGLSSALEREGVGGSW